MRGERIELTVVKFNGNPVLEAQFIHYDAELRDNDLREHGISKLDYEQEEEFLFGHEVPPDFRSVRIFHLAQGEEIELKCGDKIRAVVESSYIGKQKTKDGRRKLHVTVCNAQRVYHWTRVYLPQKGLVLKLWCGSRLAQEREIPLTVRRGIHSENGWACPVIAEVLPDGSILRVSRDTRRAPMITGDYRLQERQRGRTMQDIDKDFLRVYLYDRMIPTRDRRYMHRMRRIHT